MQPGLALWRNQLAKACILMHKCPVGCSVGGSVRGSVGAVCGCRAGVGLHNNTVGLLILTAVRVCGLLLLHICSLDIWTVNVDVHSLSAWSHTCRRVRVHGGAAPRALSASVLPR